MPKSLCAPSPRKSSTSLTLSPIASERSTALGQCGPKKIVAARAEQKIVREIRCSCTAAALARRTQSVETGKLRRECPRLGAHKSHQAASFSKRRPLYFDEDWHPNFGRNGRVKISFDFGCCDRHDQRIPRCPVPSLKVRALVPPSHRRIHCDVAA
jgi:hypothetical protein